MELNEPLPFQSSSEDEDGSNDIEDSDGDSILLDTPSMSLSRLDMMWREVW